MLNINEQQMTAFKQNAMEQFRDKMIQHLRTAFPEQTLVIFDEQLKQYVQSGIIQAMQYAITQEWDIRRYLEYALCHGWNFDHPLSSPEINKILTTPDIDGTKKMNTIEQLI